MKRGATVDELLNDWDEGSQPGGPNVDLNPLSSRLPQIDEAGFRPSDNAAELLGWAKEYFEKIKDDIFGLEKEGGRNKNTFGHLINNTKKFHEALQALEKKLGDGSFG